MSFIDWLYGNGGIPGDYDYTMIHFVSVGVIFVLTVILAIIAGSKKISDRAKRIILICISVFQLTFEVVWRIVYLCRGDDFWSLWPFYVCNLNGILLPIAALTNNKIMKEMFYVFGFVGGILTFIMPKGIFYNAYFNFPILKSLLQHTALVFIPVFEFVSGTFRPSIKNCWLALVGMLIHVANSLGMSALLGYPGDYLYFNSGLPFVIPGVPGWLVMSITAVLVVMIVYICLDFKNVFLRKRQKVLSEKTNP